MKGIQGLILALGLGIAGALFNWAYLQSRSSDLEIVQFVGIAPDATVNAGERLTDGHLAPVDIPSINVGNLRDFAFLWSEKGTVKALPVNRTLTGGSLLLREDLRTPPETLRWSETLGENEEERGMCVPITTKGFIASLFNPGDLVDFMVSTAGVPTPAMESGSNGEALTGPRSSVEIIGPFKILALGNRLGDLDPMRAKGMSPTQENVITVSVKMRYVDVKRKDLKTGRDVTVKELVLEEKAQRLWNLLNQTTARQMTVLMRPNEADRK